MGKPTASSFDRIVTPTGKLSTQADRYMMALLAELVMGHPIVGTTMPWMDRGKELEAEAVSFYELQRDADTTPVGFITTDCGRIGASPDRLVGADGLLEIKCPSPEIHMTYLLAGKAAQEYKPQLQGQLYVAERSWVDICSYHPEMPQAIVRVERDEKYIELLATALDSFCELLGAKRRMLTEQGLIKPPTAAPETTDDSLGVSDEDVDQILARQDHEPEPLEWTLIESFAEPERFGRLKSHERDRLFDALRQRVGDGAFTLICEAFKDQRCFECFEELLNDARLEIK
jgi:hypothetical protein